MKFFQTFIISVHHKFSLFISLIPQIFLEKNAIHEIFLCPLVNEAKNWIGLNYNKSEKHIKILPKLFYVKVVLFIQWKFSQIAHVKSETFFCRIVGKFFANGGSFRVLWLLCWVLVIQFWKNFAKIWWKIGVGVVSRYFQQFPLQNAVFHCL